MKVLFTFEDQTGLERSFYLINWFKFNGHDVYVYYDGIVHGYMKERCIPKIESALPYYNCFDIWIYSVKGDSSWEGRSKFDLELNEFKGKLYWLSMEDSFHFHSQKVNPRILDKTVHYIGNVWYKNKDEYVIYDEKLTPMRLTEKHKNKFKLIPSFHESSNYAELENVITVPFKDKRNNMLFIGSITGDLPVQDARFHSIHKLTKTHSIQADIRVTGYCPDPINTYYYNKLPDYMKQSRLSFLEYINEINTCKFSLCPKGNSPHITYRFYESLKYKSLVFINKISSDVEFYDPSVLYQYCVWYNPDCSDLLELITYYANNMDEAEQIAENGYVYWKQFQFYPNGEVSPVLHNHLTILFNL